MRNILIHCAMEKEGIKIANKLNLIKKEETKLITIYEGISKETKINLLITGIGKQRTAIGLTVYLNQNIKPDIIINIGYAGSTNEKIGNWINISKSYNLEWYIPGEEKYEMQEIKSKELEELDELKKLPCYSAECFVTNTDIKENVIFDMELHSVYILSNIYNIPLKKIKKVTDNLNMKDYYSNIEQKEVMELESSIKYIEKYII